MKFDARTVKELGSYGSDWESHSGILRYPFEWKTRTHRIANGIVSPAGKRFVAESFIFTLQNGYENSIPNPLIIKFLYHAALSIRTVCLEAVPVFQLFNALARTDYAAPEPQEIKGSFVFNQYAQHILEFDALSDPPFPLRGALQFLGTQYLRR